MAVGGVLINVLGLTKTSYITPIILF